MTTSTKPTEMREHRNRGGRPTLPQARRRSKSVTVKLSKIDYETLRIRSRKANRRLAPIFSSAHEWPRISIAMGVMERA